MSWKEAFYEDVKTYLNNENVVKIIDVDERTQSGGYCESCYYEEQVVVVTYLDRNGDKKETTEYFTMSDFMKYVEDKNA